MDYYNQNNPQPQYNYSGSMTVAQQTNAVLKKVYVRMFIGMLITAFCSLAMASSQAAMVTFMSNKLLFWSVPIVMLVMAFALPMRLNKMSTTACFLLFLAYSALMGVWLAPIFYVYTKGTIVYTFFITAGLFGAMSVYGYFTKTDLSKFGTFCIMALIGLVIAMVVNIFLASSTLDWIISIVGVLLFVGLTAWDTQTVKQLAAANLSPQLTDKLATMGAFNLYLDFINLFLFLLRFVGGGRD